MNTLNTAPPLILLGNSDRIKDMLKERRVWMTLRRLEKELKQRAVERDLLTDTLMSENSSIPFLRFDSLDDINRIIEGLSGPDG